MIEPGQRRWHNHWMHFLAFGFGSGALPKAPGTFGTLAALPFLALLSPLSVPLYLLVLLVALVFGCYLCDRVSHDMGVHDHGGIVWDEFVGVWIVFVAVPLNLWTIIAGFLLFRFFDVIKPWPISWLDKRVAGGVGIMIDDVIAGVFAWVLMQALLWLF